MSIGFIWFRIGNIDRLLIHGDETSGSVKGGKIPD
jgi:hypothetical protein